MSQVPRDLAPRAAWAWRRHSRARWAFRAALAVAAVCLAVVVVQWDRFMEGTPALAIAVPILPGALWTAWYQFTWGRRYRGVALEAEAALGEAGGSEQAGTADHPPGAGPARG